MTDKELQDFFDMLDGEWHFIREVSGRTASASAQGTARFTRQNPHEYDFRENGTLSLTSGEKMQFFRSYIYRLTQNRLDVLYGDGPQQGEHYQSYRYDPEFNRLLAVEEHHCSADCYRGTYRLIDRNTFILRTEVDGPKKDYVIGTTFIRKPQI